MDSRPIEAPLVKKLVAGIYVMVGLDRLDSLQRAVPALVGVNYHQTPACCADSLDRQLRWFAQHFAPLAPSELGAFLLGERTSDKPGLMIHFDDGYLNNALVAAPLLEQYGMRGWFHLPTDFVDSASQLGASRDQVMTWDIARDLARRGHSIGSHTCSHLRLSSTVPDSTALHEVAHSYDRITAELGAPPLAFCWPGGEASNYDARALRAVRDKYQFAFASYPRVMRPSDSPLALSRANVEASWSLNLVKLSIGWLWTLRHAGRAQSYRSKVEHVLAMP